MLVFPVSFLLSVLNPLSTNQQKYIPPSLQHKLALRCDSKLIWYDLTHLFDSSSNLSKVKL